MVIYEEWLSKLVVATNEVFVEALVYDKVKRNYLKLHNRSKDNYLKVAFSKEDSENGIYVLVQPLGFWNFNDEIAIPRNSIFVAGEGSDVEVVIYCDQVGRD